MHSGQLALRTAEIEESSGEGASNEPVPEKVARKFLEILAKYVLSLTWFYTFKEAAAKLTHDTQAKASNVLPWQCRDEDGLCVCDAYTCVNKHNTIEDVVQFTMQMSQSVGLFEVVSVDVDDGTFNTANQFHGTADSVNDNDSDDDLLEVLSNDDDLPSAQLARNRSKDLPQMQQAPRIEESESHFHVSLGHDEQNQLAEMEETLTEDVIDKDFIPTIEDLLHCSESDISSDDAMPTRQSRKRKRNVGDWKIYELYVDTFERKKDAQRQFPNPHTDRFSALHSIFHSREESKTDAIFVQGTRTFSGTDMAEYRDLLN
ncbi:hypothetical protein RRG08_044441 [Elysia crispata]|uniref:Uncharacterized protein n=1 Tax=Elysia crispata TaxID=231223 RepID=A0AAE0Y2V4_9GAST|nr:hypothetical protein RRG08_044441 [Elysia crispata]